MLSVPIDFCAETTEYVIPLGGEIFVSVSVSAFFPPSPLPLFLFFFFFHIRGDVTVFGNFSEIMATDSPASGKKGQGGKDRLGIDGSL